MKIKGFYEVYKGVSIYEAGGFLFTGMSQDFKRYRNPEKAKATIDKMRDLEKKEEEQEQAGLDALVNCTECGQLKEVEAILAGLCFECFRLKFPEKIVYHDPDGVIRGHDPNIIRMVSPIKKGGNIKTLAEILSKEKS